MNNKRVLQTIALMMMTSFYSLSGNSLPGGETALLTKMLGNQIKQLKNEIDQIKEARATVQTMRDVLDATKELESEYKRLNAFDLDRELKSIQRSVEGIFSLGSLEDANTTQEKFRAIFNEIDRRITGNSKNDTESEVTDLSDQYEALRIAAHGYANEAVTAASEDKTMSDQLAGINSATSIMASQMLEDQLIEKERQLKNMEQFLEHKKSDDYFMRYLNDNDSRFEQ